MRRIFFALTISVSCLLLLTACGQKQSEAERRYSDACVKYSKSETSRKLCDCSATIVVPKLTPGELNAYVNSVDLIGKPMTEQSIAPLGFTLADFTNLGQTRQDSFAEMRKTCKGEI
jgi:hypothetical protein